MGGGAWECRSSGRRRARACRPVACSNAVGSHAVVTAARAAPACGWQSTVKVKDVRRRKQANSHARRVREPPPPPPRPKARVARRAANCGPARSDRAARPAPTRAVVRTLAAPRSSPRTPTGSAGNARGIPRIGARSRDGHPPDERTPARDVTSPRAGPARFRRRWTRRSSRLPSATPRSCASRAPSRSRSRATGGSARRPRATSARAAGHRHRHATRRG